MPISHVNGVRLYWERHGETGPPLVLVHGSWGDHHNWGRVVPALAQSCRVLVYDRRGHSQSERPASQGSIEEDVADLAALLREQAFVPGHVAGNSFGAAIALRLAVTQPELFASLTVHEPPLMALLQGGPLFPAFIDRVGKVIAALRQEQWEEGARRFVETIAFGPGAWDTLPQETRDMFVYNAPTFLDESNEPSSLAPVGFDRLPSFPHPVLVTDGPQGPPFFAPVLQQVADALPQAERHTFREAGHVPHITHPDEYVKVVSAFIARAARQGQPADSA